jgi:hypothetical protein
MQVTREKIADAFNKTVLARKSTEFIGGPGGAAPRAKAINKTRGRDGHAYFDEEFQLWVVEAMDAAAYRYDLFEDEALTKPAGYFRSTYSEGDDMLSYTMAYEFEILKGPMSVTRGSAQIEFDEEGGGTGRMEYTAPDGSRSVSTIECDGGFEDGSFRETNRTEYLDGTWSSFESEWFFDGRYQVAWSTSDGYGWSFNYGTDGSGTGRIEGPVEGLPATLEWNWEGVGTITWADGTKEVFNWWEWWGSGDGDGDGDSGSGGGGEPPKRNRKAPVGV